MTCFAQTGLNFLVQIYSDLWGRYAELLVDYSLEVRPNEYILVNSTSNAEPLLLEFYRALLERGAWPEMNIKLPNMEEVFYTYAQDHHLDTVSKTTEYITHTINARVFIDAPTNTRNLSSINPQKQARYARGRKEISEYIAQSNIKFLFCAYPTTALAQDADMSISQYWEFIAKSLHLNHENPVQIWQERSQRQRKIIDELSKAKEIHIEGPETNIRLLVTGRNWINGAGKQNMPCGEIFTSPIEDSVDGYIYYGIPMSFFGQRVEGVRLRFKEGKVIEASAEVGNEYLQSQLNTDEDARFLGEIGIGTNYQIQKATGSLLFDEKIGGTVHLALGRGFKEAGGQNKSSIHWDMICDLRQNGRIFVDGKLFQENGQFINYDFNF